MPYTLAGLIDYARHLIAEQLPSTKFVKGVNVLLGDFQGRETIFPIPADPLPPGVIPPAGAASADPVAEAKLSAEERFDHPCKLEIIAILREKPGRTFQQLMHDLARRGKNGVPAFEETTVKKHLKSMIEDGIIENRQDLSPKGYRLASED